MPIVDDRAKAVELALAQIEKQFGKGSIVPTRFPGGATAHRGDSGRGSISFDSGTWSGRRSARPGNGDLLT